MMNNILELIVDNKAREKILKVKNEQSSFAFFRASNVSQDTAFMIIHGTEDGYLMFNYEKVTIKYLLDFLISSGVLVKQDIKHVEVICCYPGLHDSYTHSNGISISTYSNHTSTTKSCVGRGPDNKLYFCVFAQE